LKVRPAREYAVIHIQKLENSLLNVGRTKTKQKRERERERDKAKNITCASLRHAKLS
jgi:hypothetical protein